jgi:hypothetical protein|tara:strand:- start:1379 stop:2134 length:756 start_codon:yes stop_codon:yes gene_type:complete
MKQLLAIILFGISNLVFSQTDLPYKVGEYAAYKVSFGAINVGFADLEITERVQLNNRPAFHIIGKGRTAPFFDWFFKVRDVYETFIDTNTLLPLAFKRAVNEGGYLINQRYQFNHNNSKVITQDSSFFIPINTQDMLSAFFLARTFKKESIINGQPFYIPLFMDDENYNLEIKYLTNEIMDTKWGKIDCMVFNPKMQEGRVFEDGEKIKIWITDDANHLLLKVETEIWAGSIKAVLEDYKELKQPLSIIGD